VTEFTNMTEAYLMIERLEGLLEKRTAIIRKQADQIETLIKDAQYRDMGRMLNSSPQMTLDTQFQQWWKDQKKWWKRATAI